MRYETPIIEILSLLDDVIATSAQPGLGNNPDGALTDENGWGDINNW